jgi:hypothetical protein
MKKKISSDLTKIFQITGIIKLITLSIILLLALLLSDFKTKIIFTGCWIAVILIFRLMGITKLKTVYWTENSLSIGSFNLNQTISFSDIISIKRTFLFDDFPFKIKYSESGKLKTLYFLPKSKIFQDMMSENELIEKLKKEIKKSNANTV